MFEISNNFIFNYVEIFEVGFVVSVMLRVPTYMTGFGRSSFIKEHLSFSGPEKIR